MLTSKQRHHLSSLAQTLPALMAVGRAGESDGIADRLDHLLGSHELVKLRFGEFKDEKTDIAHSLAEKTGSELVRIIGNTAIFFRVNPDPEKRKIDLVSS